MEHTSEKVGLLYDCGHLYYSEGSQEATLRVLEKHIGRVVHVHLKDVRPNVLEQVRCEKLSFLEGVRAGSFTVPSDGVIHFEPIFACLAAVSYTHLAGGLYKNPDRQTGTAGLHRQAGFQVYSRAGIEIQHYRSDRSRRQFPDRFDLRLIS